MAEGSVLVVDDDFLIRESVSELLRLEGYDVQTAHSGHDALRSLASHTFDIIFTDINMPEISGFDLLREVNLKYPETRVVLITGFGEVQTAVQAIKQGAYDYVQKPVADDDIKMIARRVMEQKRLTEENRYLRQRLGMRPKFANFVGQDPKIQKIFEIIEAIADTKTTVMITGESGTGKTLIARAIHYNSSRRNGPFVEVSCGALPETLLESELFGHVEGSFTGAISDKIGKFELAHGGTIFLDEINTASPSLQVKLLRAIQEREFERVGGTETVSLDVRFILATNYDLRQEVEDGNFRKDLFYRVNVVPIHMPPLRERVGDIPLLAEHFLRLYARQNRCSVTGISPEAMLRLKQYQWPGNVRELENALEAAVVLRKEGELGVGDLPATITGKGSPEPLPLKEALLRAERDIIEHALRIHNWRRQPTAAMLAIDRTTLFKKMRLHGLVREDAEEDSRTP
ncbi:MAG TPA: sigma-54 dependent transcriptional regulator [Planctomycetota bacterium]|nr:sigma-54 dependent transcriptional regulator [Planctomycetota bacterium]HRR83238.1 sigma-54 dependent transcriptional regulator [Planctomycetota bacterium]